MIPLVATTMITLKNEVEVIALRQVGLQGLVVWQHMVIMQAWQSRGIETQQTKGHSDNLVLRGETKEEDIVNFFGYTLRDDIFEQKGKLHVQSHPYCTICFKLGLGFRGLGLFQVGTQGFCKGYYKVQMDEQVYVTLQTLKQRPSGVNEEIL